MTNKEPEALQFADMYDHGDPLAHGNAWKVAVCKELRRLHAENEALKQKIAATQPAAQGMDDRDVFEREYAEHAIAYAGLDAHVDDVVQRVKDGRDGNGYKHLHDSGAWVGWNLVLAAQAKQGGVEHG